MIKEEKVTEEELNVDEAVVEETSDQDNVEELKAAEVEIDYKAKFYYMAAEMENVKRRFQREKSDLLNFGSEKILTDLVDVVDNFERTVDALKLDEDDKVKNIVVGVEMVRKQFLEVLNKSGLSTIECLGKEFDPNFHEAVGSEGNEEKEDMEITKEYQKGYMLNGRLLRASKVIVVQN